MPDNKLETWIILQNNRLLVIRKESFTHLLSREHVDNMHHAFIRRYRLAFRNEHSILCAELAPEFQLSSYVETISIRSALEELGDKWYDLATKAVSIINWDNNHQYCGKCGQKTLHIPDSFERRCQTCDLFFYPRISPSVIVLVKKDDHLLMARGNHFKPGVFGLLAGFVEAGETLEDTIHREIKEEVNIHVKNIRYIQSQSWPFPDSLMIGFFADYASGTIEADGVEIEHANWYRYDNLPGRPSTNISIANKLIELYIQEQMSLTK